MDKQAQVDRQREREEEIDREDEIRRSLDEMGGSQDKVDPRGAQDPVLLELTEDPRERR